MPRLRPSDFAAMNVTPASISWNDAFVVDSLSEINSPWAEAVRQGLSEWQNITLTPAATNATGTIQAMPSTTIPGNQMPINPVRVAHDLCSSDISVVREAILLASDAQYYGLQRRMRLLLRRMETQGRTNELVTEYRRLEHGRDHALILQRISGLIEKFGRTGAWVTCNWAGNYIPQSTAIMVDGAWVGQQTYNEFARRCEECEGMFHQHSMERHRNRMVCNSCYNELRNSAYPYTCDYSGDPMRYRTGFLSAEGESVPSNHLFLGVELEVEPRDEDQHAEILEKLNEELPHCIFKPDGSLGEYGIEIVSVPATLAYHRTAWDKFFDSSAKMVKGWHVGHCGMHVHMSIAAISDLTLGKMLIFINDPLNAKFMTDLSGRYQGNYCFYSPKWDKSDSSAVPRIGRQAKGGTGHYEALSVSTHTGCKTAEMRIFRSNVSRSGFLKNIEFCEAIKKFCDYSAVDELNPESFAKWMRSHRKPYPELHGWLVHRNYIKLKEESEKDSKYSAVIKQIFSEAA